jgi:hypothetical protein
MCKNTAAKEVRVKLPLYASYKSVWGAWILKCRLQNKVDLSRRFIASERRSIFTK